MVRFPRLLLLLVFCACATKVVQLDVPAGAWDVSGSNPRVWNRPLSFGPYRTESVDEGTRRSWLVDAGLLAVGRIDQGTRLRIAGTDVECHTRELLVGKNDLFVDPALGRAALLVCGYQHDGGRSVLTLSRTVRSDAWLTGELRGESRSPLEVRSMNQPANSRFRSMETLGFEILDGGRQVAVIETVNQGRVWISPESKDRDLLAAVSASLLLFRDPDGEFME